MRATWGGAADAASERRLARSRLPHSQDCIDIRRGRSMLRDASPESGEIAKSADILRSMSKCLTCTNGGWQDVSRIFDTRR